jgi:hypothetical protein
MCHKAKGCMQHVTVLYLPYEGRVIKPASHYADLRERDFGSARVIISRSNQITLTVLVRGGIHGQVRIQGQEGIHHHVIAMRPQCAHLASFEECENVVSVGSPLARYARTLSGGVQPVPSCKRAFEYTNTVRRPHVDMRAHECTAAHE